jgi:hypothetical protein
MAVRVIKGIKALVREDKLVAAFVLAFVVFQLFGLMWDLPGTFGWENDGVAPRDFFGGLANNLTPGKGHRYPLFHYLILAVFCLPILGTAALMAESFTLKHLMAAMLTTPVMTGCAIVAKLIAIAMSALTLLLLARIARRIFAQNEASPFALSVGRWAVLFAATNLSVAYYGRVTNLDGPYLFWTVAAIDRLVALARTGERRDYVLFGFFAAAAVATKDQAYASFMLVAPLYLLLLPLLKKGSLAAQASGKHWRYLLYATISSAVVYGVLSGAFLNPTGYLERLATMSGTASQDWRQYAPGVIGMLQNLGDLAKSQAAFFWPWPVVAAAWLGVVAAFRNRPDGAPPLVWRALPLVLGISFIAFFTLVVARCEHRFLLPVGLWLALYAGLLAATLMHAVSKKSEPLQRRVRIAMMILVAAGAYQSIELLLTQYGDARRVTVRYLAKLPQGSTVETYGLLVYQPHFDFSKGSPYRVQRMTTRPIKRRNPLTGAKEIKGTFMGAVTTRKPDVLVITDGYASRFMLQTKTPKGGFRTNLTNKSQSNHDATLFFRSAVSDSLPGYKLVLVAKPELPSWAATFGLRPQIVHGSTGRPIWILRRSR